MNEATQPFTSFAQCFTQLSDAGTLVVPRCEACGMVLGYTRRICACGSPRVGWQPAQGIGTVVAQATYRRSYAEQFPPPHCIVRIALDEGPHLTAVMPDAATPPQPGTRVRLQFNAKRLLVASPT